MRSIRRVGGLAVAGILLTAVASGPASADTPASYTGSASGHALKLSGLGQTFTAGQSEASAASSGTSKGVGTGDTLVSGTIVTANNPPGETKPEECAAALPPAPLDTVLSLGLGCGAASATGTGLTTAATATGKVAGLDVNVQTVLSQLPVTDPLVSGISGGLDDFCAALPAQLQTVCTPTGQTVQTVLQSVASTQTLAAEIGSSTSGVTVDGNSVTSDSTAQAAVVKILPLPTLNGVSLGDPFATITVARANAKVVCDLTSGNAVPSFDPAIVRVKLSAPIIPLLSQVGVTNPLPIITIPGNPLINGELAPVLNLQNGEFTVTPGTTVVLFPGTPIQTTIRVGSGTAKVNADKSANATADGVSIAAAELAPAPLTGGLLLSLAHAEAAGACVAATVTPPTTTIVETPRELPRTGGTPWLPIAGVAALAVAVVTRRAVRSH
jgi:hypothetical protein